MATKRLAHELGLVRRRSRPSNENDENLTRCAQQFSYLIVIDFESTCWEDKNSYGQEIIEFPAVLLNTSNGKIESEFHSYVQPQEHPVLSRFCTELTGIQQEQVEAGVPLRICLSRFTRWIQRLQEEKRILFIQEKVCSRTGHPCAFVTWSGELEQEQLESDHAVKGVLKAQYECKRKQIGKPEILNCWIDLRATYKLFYNRKPKGLNGALQDLGIRFSGREHSGLDDARNTAHLAWRMITDGCLMKLTRSLDRAPLRTKPQLQMNHSSSNARSFSVREGRIGKHFVRQPKPEDCGNDLESSENKRNFEVSSNLEKYQYESLITPKTLSCGLSTSVANGNVSVPMPVGQFGLNTSPLSATSATLSERGQLLVTTTICCITSTEAGIDVNADPATLSCEWTETPVLIESEESGSYDDVILEEGDESVGPFMETATAHDSNSMEPNTDSSLVNASFSHSKQVVFKTSNTAMYSFENQKCSSSSCGLFKVPLLSNGKVKDKSAPLSNVLRSGDTKVTCIPKKSEYTGLKLSTLTGSSTVHKAKDSSKMSSDQLRTPPSLAPSSVNRRSLPPRSTMKMTSPLCSCGRRAKRLIVANGGPNHGRAFFSCPIGKTSPGNKKRCEFFKWESSLLRGASSTMASHSLCSVPGTGLTSRKYFANSSFSPQANFTIRPSLRN